MSEEYKQGEEFKTGLLGAGAKRFKLEGKRQGREAYHSGHADEDGHNSPEARRADTDFQAFAALDQQATTIRLQLDQAELAAAEALEDAQKREQQASQTLERIRKAATQTEDGRTVYLTADGTRAFDDQGNELTPEEMAGIDWHPDGPTWEERQEAGGRLEEAIQDRQEIEDYQDRIEQGRDRLDSDSLTVDELDEIEADLEAMPEAVREHLGGYRTPPLPEAPRRVGNPDTRASAAAEYEGQGIKGSPLNPAFQRAAFALEPDEMHGIEKTTAAAPKPLDI